MTPLTSLDIPILAGLLVAPVLSGLIYLDTTRRGLPSSRGLLSALGVGVASFGGFLITDTFRRQLAYVYLHSIKTRPVVIAPYEILLVELATGLAISALAVLLYAVSSRYASFEGGAF